MLLYVWNLCYDSLEIKHAKLQVSLVLPVHRDLFTLILRKPHFESCCQHQREESQPRIPNITHRGKCYRNLSDGKGPRWDLLKWIHLSIRPFWSLSVWSRIPWTVSWGKYPLSSSLITAALVLTLSVTTVLPNSNRKMHHQQLELYQSACFFFFTNKIKLGGSSTHL